MKYSYKDKIRKLIIPVLATLVLSIIMINCSNDNNIITEPTGLNLQQQTAEFNISNPEVLNVMNVQDKHTEKFMENPEIVGTATGLTEDGKLAILVLSKVELPKNALAKLKNPIPEKLEEIPVQVIYTGELRPMKGKPGGKINHKAIQTPPIKLGTSGGWRYDLANGYCCVGTLGSLIKSGGKQYILSNYHVLSADIVAGDNNRVTTIGDYVIQPGLVDVGCDVNKTQNVATLASVNVLPDANVDAAIAEVIPGMVSSTGEILGIGTLSSTTLAAAIGQAVKKSGRTTGLTRSTIQGLNATIKITYEDECAGGEVFTKTFTGQIIIKNKASRFLDGGDSGSLLVEDVDTNPKAIGLLFAGSKWTAIANPIDEVLSHFNATMVGN